MPHSKAKSKAITNRLRSIDRTVKRLEKVNTKKLQEAEVIFHSKVRLGTLRDSFSPHHKKIPPHLLENIPKFQRIPSNPTRPLYIYGKDGGLLAYRGSLNNDSILETLTSTLKVLPARTNHKFRGIDRGSYSTRHYCTWSPYAKTPFISSELVEDGKAGLEFLKANDALWNRLSLMLAEISPTTYKQFLRYPLPKDKVRFCTAWAGCVINLGGKDPVQTKPHRDVKESIFGFSCVVPSGNYTGGALILYDLEMVVELMPGEVFLFPDSLIHHANEDIVGDRSSIVAFTQENMFHYWRRKYGFVNNKDKRKSHSKKTLRRIKRKA
jgi:hypothetical protein